MSEEKLSFLWIASTILLLIAFYLFGKAWESEDSKLIFIFFFSLLIVTIAFFLYDRTNKSEVLDREMSKKLMDAREAEKRKIASDLHDGLQQELHSINFELQRLAKNPSYLRQQLNHLSERVIASIDNIRSISSNLYPYMIDKLGLRKSVEALVNDLTYSSSIYFGTKITENLDYLFDKDYSIHIYRIIQELCNNIIKHSNASRANIEIYADKIYLYIKVQDNGKGLGSNYKQMDPFRNGLGMNSIRERSKLLKGSFNIDSASGGGALFKITIPLKKI